MDVKLYLRAMNRLFQGALFLKNLILLLINRDGPLIIENVLMGLDHQFKVL